MKAVVAEVNFAKLERPEVAGLCRMESAARRPLVLRVVGHLPARAAPHRVFTGPRAGVGQASREETAAHAAVVVEGWVAMAIGAVRPW